MIVAGTTSYPGGSIAEPFRAIADEVGAVFLFDAAHIAGLIAGGAHPTPVPDADIVTFTTHKTLRGPRAVASSPRRSSPRRSTRRCSRAGRAARSSTSSPARRWPSARPPIRRSRSTPTRSWPTRRRSPRRWRARGFRLVSGGTDNHLMVVDLRRSTPSSPARSARGARRGRHHAQQEHHPRRPAEPVRHQGPRGSPPPPPPPPPPVGGHCDRSARSGHGEPDRRRAGITASGLRSRVQSGILERIRTHTYRSPFAASTPLADLAAVVLDCGVAPHARARRAAAPTGSTGSA